MTRLFKSLSLRWKFMLAPGLGIVLMAILVFVFVTISRDDNEVLAKIQNEEFAHAQTLISLSSRIADNHTKIYDLLRSAQDVTDEGQFYDLSKPLLYEVHRLEELVEGQRRSHGLGVQGDNSLESLQKLIAEYRVNTTNAMLMATVDPVLASNVMSNSTNLFNQMNAQLLSINQIFQQHSNDALEAHNRTSKRHTQLFILSSLVIVCVVLAISVTLSSVLSLDLRRSIARLSEIVSVQKPETDQNLSETNEVDTLAAAIDDVRESYVSLDRTRAELDTVNQQLTKSYKTILERETSLEELNKALERRIEEQQAAIAAREKAEEALRRSQKLEAVGQLTGGVAHDFNNLLAVMLGNAEFLELFVEKNAKLKYHVDAIKSAVTRGASLTQRLLAFSRQQQLKPKSTDVTDLIDGLQDMLQRALGETVDLQVKQTDGLWPAVIDPHQFENALVNLAINARDAMPDGGQLTIESTNQTLGEPYTAFYEDVAAGDYVCISVSDSGIGMTPETLEKVFEPFFTTKEMGKGTGLGLSMVYGFVKQSGGHVTIYSEPGYGTTVNLYIPRSHDAVTGQDLPDDVEKIERGCERILIVEDDPALREVSVRMLRDNGYDVVETGSGPEAIAELEAGQSFHLLFTDMVLPGGMNGMEIAKQAKRLQTNIRTLYTTGYAEHATFRNGTLQADMVLVNKPYRRSELLGKVRTVLDQL